ncbi:MAG: hypothetical protein V2I33_16420 [Kangiellaceae bacterium]|jgi:hypothetical protein|nr:hypothetical protein [Kangiellaceae bacterium]
MDWADMQNFDDSSSDSSKGDGIAATPQIAAPESDDEAEESPFEHQLGARRADEDNSVNTGVVDELL